MNKAKEQKLLDAIFSPHFQTDLIRALNRQGAALETLVWLGKRRLDLTERYLLLKEKGTTGDAHD
jgi:hypothetical protein